MRLRILIFSLIIFISVGIIGFFFLTVKNEKVEKENEINSAAEVTKSKLEVKGLRFVETIGGKPRWELFAKNASVDEVKTNFEEIKCIFFSSKQNNEPILTIEAKKGILNTNTRDIDLIGEVKAITNQGVMFTTNTLKWQANPGIFVTNDAITLTHERVHIFGYGLEVNPEVEKVEIKRRVKIKIKSS